MAHQIIKQPNGLYCVWSTVVDNFVLENATASQIARYWISIEKREIRRRVKNVTTALEKGERPYHQFTMSYEDALRNKAGGE